MDSNCGSSWGTVTICVFGIFQWDINQIPLML